MVFYSRKKFGSRLRSKFPRRKRVMRKKYVRRVSRKPGIRGFAPLGLKQAVRLRYCDHVALNPAVGYSGDYVYRANDLYDPNLTGTGHQPYGFDQLMAMYEHFTVVGSKITVNFVNTQTAGTPMICALKLDTLDTTLASQDMQYIREMPGQLARVVNTQTPGCTLRKAFSAAKHFTIPRGSVVSSAPHQGAIGASPSTCAYYHVLVGPVDSSTDLASMTLTVTIDYFAVFTNPLTLGSS